MPEAGLDLRYALRLEPAEAVEYFRAKGIAVTDDWRELWQAAHTRAFTVAKMAKHDLLESTRRIVARSISGEMTSQQAAAVLKEELRKAGWWGKRAADGAQLGSARRIRTILRTNAATAYAAGRHQRQVESAGARPWWRYVAVMDGVTRLAHRQLHGKILKHDDPAWEAIYPPNGFNCRCRVVSMSERQAKAAFEARPNAKMTGAAPQTRDVDMVDRRTGEVFQRPVTHVRLTDGAGGERWFAPDAGWGHNPGAALRRPKPRMFADPNQRDWKAFGRPSETPRHAALAGLGVRRSAAARMETLRKTYDIEAGESRRVATPDGVEDVVIHDDMLWHIAKSKDKTRVRFANRLLPTLEDPDEVWLVGYKNKRGDYEFRRHFLRGWDDQKATFTVVAEDADGWLFYTFFPMSKRTDINQRRLGELLYFRPQGEE